MSDRKWLRVAFKALSDPIRLRILRLLAANNAQMCVCELVDALQERQYTISRGLGLLEQAGLVQGQKDGRWVIYSLINRDDPIVVLLHDVAISVEDDDVLSLDQKRFENRMALREEGCCQIGIQTVALRAR